MYSSGTYIYRKILLEMDKENVQLSFILDVLDQSLSTPAKLPDYIRLSKFDMALSCLDSYALYEKTK